MTINSAAATTTITSTLPLLLTLAIDCLPKFIESLLRARPDSIRAMRPERQECLLKLLTAMLRSCSLQHDGVIAAINGAWVRPKVIAELADQAGISFAQAKRGMADLRKMEYMASSQIKRKNAATGQLEVSPGLRVLTPKFWKALGLWDMFKQSVAWAKKHCKRKFQMPFRAVKIAAKKIKPVFTAAASVVVSTMGKISGGDAARVKSHCAAIRAMLARK